MYIIHTPAMALVILFFFLAMGTALIDLSRYSWHAALIAAVLESCLFMVVVDRMVRP